MSAWDDEMSVDDGVVTQRNWDKDYQVSMICSSRERERERGGPQFDWERQVFS